LFITLLPNILADTSITVINPPLNNTAENKTILIRFQTPDLINLTDTSAHIKYKMATAVVGYEYLCWDDFDKATFSACWGQTDVGTITTENVFAGPSSAREGPAGVFQYNVAGNNNITFEGFMANNVSRAGAIQRNMVPMQFTVGGDTPGTTAAKNKDGSTNSTGISVCSELAVCTDPTYGANKKWIYWELNSFDTSYWELGNNWTKIYNQTFNQSDGIVYNIGSVGLNTGGGDTIVYYDNIKIYNGTPSKNASNSLISIVPMGLT